MEHVYNNPEFVLKEALRTIDHIRSYDTRNIDLKYDYLVEVVKKLGEMAVTKEG